MIGRIVRTTDSFGAVRTGVVVEVIGPDYFDVFVYPTQKLLGANVGRRREAIKVFDVAKGEWVTP
jgi:hypothetical protein